MTARDLLIENVNDEARDNLRNMIRVRYENYCVRHPDHHVTPEEYMDSLGFA